MRKYTAGWTYWDTGRQDRSAKVRSSAVLPIVTVRLTRDVYSVHAGVTKGLAPVNWPTFDWKGFQEAEKSMIGFARECYCMFSFMNYLSS